MSVRLNSRFTVCQFLVRLRGFKPAIWRRPRVADCTLAELHRVIQACVGIPAVEPFRFARRDRRAGTVGVPSPCLRADLRLSEIVPLDGIDFRLAYEAGGGEPWRCHVAFEGWVISSFDDLYPLCVEGERAGSPNDRWPHSSMDAFPVDACPMDPQAFGELLRNWTGADPWATDRHLAWIPYDPSAIDLIEINAHLQRLCPQVGRDDRREPLIRVPLEYDEWLPFWDFAAVDDDERDRLTTTASRGGLALPARGVEQRAKPHHGGGAGGVERNARPVGPPGWAPVPVHRLSPAAERWARRPIARWHPWSAERWTGRAPSSMRLTEG